jgi:hypothetical protein
MKTFNNLPALQPCGQRLHASMVQHSFCLDASKGSRDGKPADDARRQSCSGRSALLTKRHPVSSQRWYTSKVVPLVLSTLVTHRMRHAPRPNHALLEKHGARQEAHQAGARQELGITGRRCLRITGRRCLIGCITIGCIAIGGITIGLLGTVSRVAPTQFWAD